MINEQQQNNIYEEIVKNLNGLDYKHVIRKSYKVLNTNEDVRIVVVIFDTIYYTQLEKLLDIAKNNNAIFLIESIFFLSSDSHNVKVVLH